MKKLTKILLICLLSALLITSSVAPCLAYQAATDTEIELFKSYCDGILEIFDLQMAHMGIGMYPEMLDDTYVVLGNDFALLKDLASITVSEDGFSMTITPNDSSQISAIEQALSTQFSLLAKSVENNSIILSCPANDTDILKYYGQIDGFYNADLSLMQDHASKTIDAIDYIEGAFELDAKFEVIQIHNDYIDLLQVARADAKNKIASHCIGVPKATIFSDGSSWIIAGVLGVVAIAEAAVIIKLKKKEKTN